MHIDFNCHQFYSDICGLFVLVCSPLDKTAAITIIPKRLTVAIAIRTESVVARTTVSELSTIVGLLVLVGNNAYGISVEAAVAHGARWSSGMVVSEPVVGSRVLMCVCRNYWGSQLEMEMVS